MRHFAFAGLLALAGCLSDEEPDAVDDSMTGTITDELGSSQAVGSTLVTTDNLNLRSGPSTAHAVIMVIPAGTPVATVNRTTASGGFYNIAVGDTVGWSSGLYLKAATFPSKHTLPTGVVAAMVEPPGSGDDDKGKAYTDRNYWNFCAPGAATAALSYFTNHATTWPAGYYEEPYGPHTSRTYWGDAHSRAYLMHIALEVKPPTFSRAGLPHFGVYPTTGSSLGDTRDVLNWEASGHAAGWQNFFYDTVSASGLSSATLHRDVVRDIYGGHAIVADVDTGYLPNWSRSLGHSIAIIGYDDGAGTYAYVDTCGHRCNGSSNSTNGGVWHVSQSRMHTAITSFGVGYAR